MDSSKDDYDYANIKFDRMSVIYYKNKNANYNFKWVMKLKESENTIFDMSFKGEENTDCFEVELK